MTTLEEVDSDKIKVPDEVIFCRVCLLALRSRHTMWQIATTHRGEKSPPLHCCSDMSLRKDTCSVHAVEFQEGKFELVQI